MCAVTSDRDRKGRMGRRTSTERALVSIGRNTISAGNRFRTNLDKFRTNLDKFRTNLDKFRTNLDKFRTNFGRENLSEKIRPGKAFGQILTLKLTIFHPKTIDKIKVRKIIFDFEVF
jgi:hypothetical protein